MSLFELIFAVTITGIIADAVVKLVRGHPAKEKEIKQLRARVDKLEQRMGDCVAAIEESRVVLADELAVRAELEERLDFAERLLASPRRPE